MGGVAEGRWHAVMRGETQRYWEHRVRKDPRVHDQRINLTFRQHDIR